MKIGKINVMKLTAVLLALLLCFAMVGCGGGAVFAINVLSIK